MIYFKYIMAAGVLGFLFKLAYDLIVMSSNIKKLTLSFHQDVRQLNVISHKILSNVQAQIAESKKITDDQNNASFAKIIEEKKQFNRHPHTKFKSKFNSPKTT